MVNDYEKKGKKKKRSEKIDNFVNHKRNEETHTISEYSRDNLYKRAGKGAAVKTNKSSDDVGKKEGGGFWNTTKNFFAGAVGGCLSGAGLGTIGGPGGMLAGCVVGGIASGITSVIQTGATVEANAIANKANEIANRGNAIQMASIKSEEEIAKKDRQLQTNITLEQENLQIQMGLAGTRSTSNTVTDSHTEGGSHSESYNWSDAYSDTSGISNTWGESNGYSNSHSVGHTETSTKEHSESDSVSKMLTSTYNEETGWVNEESKSRTSSQGYSMGKSNQKTYTNNISMDQALEQSSSYAVTYSHGKTDSTTQTKQVSFYIPDGKCYKLTAVPMFDVEVNIWASGYKDAKNETIIEYRKSYHPIKFIDFVDQPISCEASRSDMVQLIKDDLENLCLLQ
jgi:hypothetical protein